MPPNTRGRLPGPVGFEDRPPSGLTRRGARGRGPMRDPDRPLLAELDPPESDTATDANAAGPERELVEPAPRNGEVAALHEFNLSLFGDGGNPGPTNVVQGNLDNCPVAATLIALAYTRDQAITAMVSEQAARIRSRTRRDPSGEYPHSSGRLISVQFPGGRREEVSSLLWRSGGRVAYCHSAAGTSWMSYIEKAYAVWKGRNSYDNLNRIGSGSGDSLGGYEPPDTREVFADLVGNWLMAHLEGDTIYSEDGGTESLTDARLSAILRRANSRPTIAATRADAPTGGGLEPHHSYAVLRHQGGNVQLRNPRGGEGAEVTVALAEFRERFAAVVQSSR